MKTITLALVTILLNLTNSNASTNINSRVEIIKESVELVHFEQKSHTDYNVELRFKIFAQNSCEAEFSGLKETKKDEYIAISKYKDRSACSKRIEILEFSHKINISFLTKSFPSRQFIKINGNEFLFENDLGQINLLK